MTRVVVPRSAAPGPSSQSRANATSTSSSAAAPAGPSSASTSKEETASGAVECPSDVEVTSECRRSAQVTSQLGTLQLSPELEVAAGREDFKGDSKATAGTVEVASAKTPADSQAGASTLSPSSINHEARAPSQDAARAVSASSSASAVSSSRRGTWPASPRVVVRRISKRSSPTSSRATSPRSREEDGYNSADESNPWAGPSRFEDEEERDAHFQTELRRVKGLEVRKMAADGNCLFRAVADQVYGDPEMFEDTRQMCIDYMEKERDHFAQFVTEGFTAYCKRKRRDKVYGNNLEIQAMAEMYNRPIHIFSYSTDPINIFHGQYETDLPPIRLSYHRGNHYNSLYDPTRPSVGAGLGFGSLRGANVDRDQVKAAILAQQDQQIDNALVAEGRYYSDLELTEQEIERMVMEASRAEYLAQERHRQVAPDAFGGGEPSSSGATSRSSAAAAGGSRQVGTPVSCTETLAMDDAANRNSNVRMLLSMGFDYFRVMEASSIFGDDVNNMLCYLLETDSLGQSMYRMKGKAAET